MSETIFRPSEEGFIPLLNDGQDVTLVNYPRLDKRFISATVAAVCVSADPSHAYATSVSGAEGLAVATLVGQASPALSSKQKSLLKSYSEGSATAAPSAQGFSVLAAPVKCKLSNVNVTYAECILAFRGKNIGIKGSSARYLFETLKALGATVSGAAGSVTLQIDDISCSIDPKQIGEQSGGGIACNTTMK